MIGTGEGTRGRERHRPAMGQGAWLFALPFLLAIFFLLPATEGSAQSDTGKRNDFLAGFGEIRFGMPYDEARQKLGKKAKATTCAYESGKGPCLEYQESFMVDQTPFRAYVRHTFPDKQAGMTWVDFSLAKNPDPTGVPLAECEYVHSGVIRMLTLQYGEPDHPVTEKHDPPDDYYGFDRTTAFSFKQGGRIDFNEMVLMGNGICIVRVFYRPPGS
jgi:hypothetical protein